MKFDNAIYNKATVKAKDKENTNCKDHGGTTQ